MSSPFASVDWDAYDEMPLAWRRAMAELYAFRQRMIRHCIEHYFQSMEEFSKCVDITRDADNALREQLLHVADIKPGKKS
jgi:hypothetical protein